MVKTVEQLTGVAIDGYVLTGFAGFQELVNAVGGIRVDVPYAMHDPYSHADFPPGDETDARTQRPRVLARSPRRPGR